MATPAIALDLTRLALAPVRRAPRGIDRVELAYARYFLAEWPGNCLPTLPMPWGVRCYPRELGLIFLDAVNDLWHEGIDTTTDPVYRTTKSFLRGEPVAVRENLRMAKPRPVEQARGYLKLLKRTRFTFGCSAVRTVPEDSIYLNVGQLEVFRPFLVWLSRRRDVRPVFMIHDLIPLELPEHHLDIGIGLHENILKNTAEFAKAVIVPSKAAAAGVKVALARQGHSGIPIHAEALAVGPEFVDPMQRDSDLPDTPYFVICGAIDSYKNHLLLLRVWQRLIQPLGANCPKLVIAGSPGVTGDNVMAFLRQNRDIHPAVMLSSGLSTAALRQLMAGARALLMPSLAEGFGLPIVEALAQGTPVLASDIAAHREAGSGGDVTYLPATDEAAWLSAIEFLSGKPRKCGVGYKPKTWNNYFQGITDFLLARSPSNQQ